MSAVDLLAEMVAAQRNLTAADRTQLVAAGVDPVALAYGMVGKMAVKVTGRLYEPDDAAVSAFITPVRVSGDVTPEHPEPRLLVLLGDVVDLVAWHPARPGAWALRCGNVAWAGAAEPQHMDAPPVPVHRSIAGWLAALRGIVLLTTDMSEAQGILSSLRAIEPEDEAHRRELRRILERPLHVTTRLVLPKRERRLAA